ncbi:ATP-grasp domain-containing protein [Bacillus safensis]|uniref:ATP-grasp domain-containing protein n=1 Tax=Bacillus safensis TaxID=561879 RepID=UPI00215154A7|nr:ATP-grasp domain-containing protein [Bacillus safensis]MCR6473752.1 ATP-grasp domain-containing protein [Bacillus safensis]MEE3679330.1 ATP-grasp domain-containing protein [Bacillus safensis]WHX75973.1 ATP-grasp domain-containing protein [Bacillus safensis]WHX83432.1 ATP-grasp domain-containing protein [Bacillus safensis]
MKNIITLFAHEEVTLAFKKNGFDVYNFLLDNMEDNEIFIRSGKHAKRTIVAQGVEELFSKVEQLCYTTDILAILSFTDYQDGCKLAAELNQKCPTQVKTVSPDSIELITNKYLMREHLNTIGLKSTPHLLTSEFKEAENFLNKHNKIIIKPADGQASQEVDFVNSYQTLKKLFNNKKKEKLLLEKFIEGKEYSIEGIVINGEHIIIGITEKYLIQGNYYGHNSFVESGHLFPVEFSQSTFQLIQNYLSNFFNSLDITNSLTHTEIKISGKDLVMIETHLRAGGDHIHSIVKHATNLDLYEILLYGLRGQQFTDAINYFQKSAARYIIPNPGKISRISNTISESKYYDFLKEDFLTLNKIEEFPVIRNSFDRIGGCIITAHKDSPMKIADYILSNVQVEYKNI